MPGHGTPDRRCRDVLQLATPGRNLRKSPFRNYIRPARSDMDWARDCVSDDRVVVPIVREPDDNAVEGPVLLGAVLGMPLRAGGRAGLAGVLRLRSGSQSYQCCLKVFLHSHKL